MVTSVKITAKGIKIIYTEGEDLKTMTSSQEPLDDFKGALALANKILCNHLQLKEQERYISCTGLETRTDKDGKQSYRIYANMYRPSWDKLKLKLNTGFMTQVEDEEFFTKESPEKYPYLLTQGEVEALDNLLERADEYLKGSRFEDQPELPLDGEEEEEEEGDTYEEPSYLKDW